MCNWDLVFVYQDGKLFWRHTTGPKVVSGRRAGSTRKDKYRVVRYNKKLYLEHRVIYEMCIGEIPEGYVIDHIDDNPSNNKVENLRAVPKMQNSWRLPAKGFYKDPQGKFVSQIRAANKTHILGYFNTEDEARTAYLYAKEKHHKILERKKDT